MDSSKLTAGVSQILNTVSGVFKAKAWLWGGGTGMGGRVLSSQGGPELRC